MRLMAARSLCRNVVKVQLGKLGPFQLVSPFGSARFYGTVSATGASHTIARRHGQTATKEERREFMGVFPDIVRELTADPDRKLPDVEKWFHKVLQYNVPSGRKTRGLATVTAFKTLMGEKKISDEKLRDALIVGWCVELLHNAFLIQDDIRTDRKVRRGRSTWHNLDGVGMRAVNDTLMMENSIYFLLWRYLKKESYYPRLVELFHEVTLKTSIGRALEDKTYTESGSPIFEKFTMDRYSQLTRFKSSYYTFLLPMAAGMYVSGIEAPELHRQAKTILLDMGEFYQIQEDFLDCFGETLETSKFGTDIEDGKLNWLSVVYLQRAPPSSCETFKKNYGVSDPGCVARVKELYTELRLPHIFDAYEEQNYRRIYNEIQQTSYGVPKGLMIKFMEKLFVGDANTQLQ